MNYDIIIIGTGPAGLGAAFELIENNKNLNILIIDKEKICSGGLLNDCKQNYTYPIGFTKEYWNEEEANNLLEVVKQHLKPNILTKDDLEKYENRAEKIGAKVYRIEQAHVGTDKSKYLIKDLIEQLKNMRVEVKLQTEVVDIDHAQKSVTLQNNETFNYKQLIIAPGRKGFSFLQKMMNKMEIEYIDNIVDIGIRVEAKLDNYPIVKDYYDPKIYFPGHVRTFCTNSGKALVTREKYHDFNLVNGHALSGERNENGLVNFALLTTIGLKDPVRSGQQMATFLARLANEIGGGQPLMQRIGDFRLGKRSNKATFNDDLYYFKPTCPATAGDLGLAVPSKIMRNLWNALKMLDAIVPGILHPSTIMYYPEIKMYANRPQFINEHFEAAPDVYMVGDGAGTSRGITGAWASGIRAARGILLKEQKD